MIKTQLKYICSFILETFAADSQASSTYGKCRAVVLCWILGVGTLICWNSLSSIEDYYYHVFPDYHPSRVLTLVYQPFAFGTMAFLAYNESNIDTRKRNILGYVVFFLGTLALLSLDLVTYGKGSIGSYVGICLLVAAFGVADALVQGGMLGDLALMCPELVQHYRRKAALEGSQTVSSDLSAAGIGQTDLTEKLIDGDHGNLDRLSNKELLYQNFDYAIDLFLIFAVSVSIFPGFLYENTGMHQLGSWYPLVLVTVFNLGDLVSRCIPLIHCVKMESRNALMISVVSRFLLVPAFYFTAKYADQGWMIMLVSILGLSNGYLTVCVLMAAPKGYKGPEQNALGNVLVLFLMGGIFLGAALDWLWLIGNEGFLGRSTTKFLTLMPFTST
ncbi:equilibrative nucleotide transporter 3 isoform X3 [Helianthus annuus]|uniref:equilibrative nucleotide transporter 3 isoform X3 n=1 Tax=Helianthus annuus TaxID=4232 RepID=UPI001652F26A|nr:equilibrative nucleotide transporter 3 isoform X3 [Helianthus annuus]